MKSSVEIFYIKIVSQKCDRSCCWCHLELADLMERCSGRCIPGIAGPRMDSRSPVTTQQPEPVPRRRWGRHHHHRLGGDLEPGDGLVGRALWAGAARSGTGLAPE